MKLKNLSRTCIACPEQYEGYLEDGRYVYIRCRGGYASLWIGQEEIIFDSEDNVKAELEWPDDIYKGMFEGNELFQLIEDSGIEIDDNVIKTLSVYGHNRRN